MAREATPAPANERLADVTVVEVGLAVALARAARALDQAGALAEVEQLQTVVREHVAALAALGLHPGGHSMDALADTESGGSPARALSSAAAEFARATQAYADLYTAARVLCEPEVCDLARRHIAHHIEGLRVLARLLPGALARELNAEGLFCRCICPSCGIGACLCVRTSIAMVADAWGWPGLPVGDGVELRSPPRPGSQLAAAGIHEGDRILSVDGAQVRSNDELQGALRRHQLGETAQLLMERSTGEHIEVAISHVSDWP